MVLRGSMRSADFWRDGLDAVDSSVYVVVLP